MQLLKDLKSLDPSTAKLVAANVVQSLTLEQMEALVYDWRNWARPDQIEPAGNWITWLILGGRGAGKTRTGAEWIRENVCGDTPMGKGKYGRIALVGETAADVRDVMVDGESGILATSHPDFKPLYIPSKRRLVWPNGAVALCFSAEDPDQLRGPQHDLAWCDEIAKWRYADDTWSNLQFGLRLGDNPRQLATTTPRPIKLIKELVKDETTHLTQVSTYANAAHLAAPFMNKVIKKYEGTRLGRQELEAHILDDNPYALWQRDNIDQHRIKYPSSPLHRIVVAVDPPVTTGDDADECGIVVAGAFMAGGEEHYAVLADKTSQGDKPAAWAERVAKAYETYNADKIIAESNQGGEMVRSVIRNVNPNLPVALVHATRGKVVRAEPIAALYEQGRIHHFGTMAKLEDQMCEFTTDFHKQNMGYSPDRVDALVWALTALTGQESKSGTVLLG